jgi:flagellar hook assembly protein FlgD
MRFTLDNESRVSLVIYDVSGRPVRALVGGILPSGTHTAKWDGRDDTGRDVASGVYLYRIIVGNAAFTRKAVLLR